MRMEIRYTLEVDAPGLEAEFAVERKDAGDLNDFLVEAVGELCHLSTGSKNIEIEDVEIEVH